MNYVSAGENFKYGPPITDTSGQLFIEIERYEWYTNICEHTNIPHRDERSITFKYLRSKLKKFKGMPTKFNLEVLLYYGGYEGDRNERYSTLVIYLKSSEKQRFLPNFKYEWKLSAKVLDNMAGSQQILGSAIGELTEFDPTKRATAILHRLVHRDKIFDSFNKYLEVQLEVEVVCTERVTYLPINIREIESEDPEMAVYEQY